MVGVSTFGNTAKLNLDVCPTCQIVWFDKHELRRLPPDKPHVLPEKASEVLAKELLRKDAERESREAFNQPGPDEWWQYIPAILGLPVEEETLAITRLPWLTYGLAMALVAVYAFTAGNLDAIVAEFGLKPGQLWRHDGGTFVTSFFLHGNLWHLFGNLYFLLIFGDNVEDDLGHWKYAAILAISAFAGDICHYFGNLGSMVPCIGASGGISGVITYYALRFPQARLGILARFGFYVRWIHIRAGVAALFWFILQLLLTFEQHLGVSNVAALAHLGGAVVGLIAWILHECGSRERQGVV